MQGIPAVAGATGGGIAAQPTSDAPPPQGSGQAALGASGGGLGAASGGVDAVAGATGAVSIAELVPQLQLLVAKLQELVQKLQAGGGASMGSGPTSTGGGPAGAGCGCGSPGCSHAGGAGGAKGASGAPPADISKYAGDHGHAGHDHGGARGGTRDAKRGARRVQGAGSSGPPDRARIAKWVTGDTKGVDPVLLDRLAQVGERLGKKLDVRSGNRTRAEQEVLYAKYKAGTGNLAARPGTSNHEGGRAADVYIGGVALRDDKAAARIAAEVGLAFPVASESWHTELA